jgi:uncharacterized membrane protein YfcA
LALAGLALGLTGGGGAILAVPILVYLFQVDPVRATGFSLGVVGLNAAVSAVGFGRRGLVEPRIGLAFAVPALVGVLLVRHFFVPLLPPVVAIGPWEVARTKVVLVPFAALMVAVAYSMIRGTGPAPGQGEASPAKMAVVGFLVGAVSSFLGAGGGFLIVPALLWFGRLDMKMAVGTSLMVIAIQSLVGFGVDLTHAQDMPWAFLGGVVGVMLAGSWAGAAIGKRVAAANLKKGFGWFVLVMGLAMAAKELLT